MKKIIFLIVLICLVFGGVFLLKKPQELLSPFVAPTKILAKYSFENLRQREYPGSEIKLEKVLQKENSYISYLFSFQSDNKKVTGMLNLPVVCSNKKCPVVIMLRGYADEEIYFTGLGTRKAAGFFAENGFITLAPDFLGFGGSDPSSSDILEARFYRPVEILNLLVSLQTLPQADSEKVALWGHSNGGQIALSVLEISQKNYPTTLWAPVTLGFPESVLTYTDEMDDKGEKVEGAIEEFLKIYDSSKFSIINYFSDISTPLQVHQGTADELVAVEKTDEFVAKMKSFGKEVAYYKYLRNDHNLKQSWDLVVARDLAFFKENLK